MKLRYRTCLYTLIQLVSILSLSTLAQSQARQAPTTTEPPLRLEVGSARPGGSQRVLQVILSNVSADLIDPAKYSLVYREKDGKPFVIHCKNTKDKSIAVAPGQFLPLTELLGTEMLSTGKGTNKAFQLTLVPGNGVTHAALALSIEDAQGNSVSKPLSVTWRAKPFWTTQKVFTYVVGALATLALLGKVIGYFRGGTPSAGPDCDPNLEESSTKRCPKNMPPKSSQCPTEKGKEEVNYEDGRLPYPERCPKHPHTVHLPSSQPGSPVANDPKGPEPQTDSLVQSPFSNTVDATTIAPPLPKGSGRLALEQRHSSSGSQSSITHDSLKNAPKPSTESVAPSPGDPETDTDTLQPGPPSTETSKESKSSAADSLSRSRASSSTYQTASEHASESPAQDDSDDFVPVTTSKEQAEAITKKGLVLLNKIYGPNRDPHFELSLQNVCDLINFLYVQAEAKNQAFTEGTYVVDDSEGKLFEALKSALVEQSLDAKKLSRQNLAKERSSSHSIGEKQDQSKHYGIDFAEDATLHSHMKHLLFFSFKGLDGKKKLFLKPEQDGETISTFCKSASKERLEDLESVLWGQLSRFKEILKSKLDTETYQSLEDQITLFGLSYVYRCCNILLRESTFEPTQPVEKPSNSYIGATYSYVCSLFFGQPSPTSPYEVAGLLYQVKLTNTERREIAFLKQYIEKNFDHLKCRMGREVIFGFQDLGMSTPEQNAIWEDVLQGLKITINGQTISPQSFVDTSLTGITEEASKKQFLDQLEKAIPEELHEGLFPLLNQLAEMTKKYLNSNQLKCLIGVPNMVLQGTNNSMNYQIRDIDITQIHKINVQIGSKIIILTARLTAKIAIQNQSNSQSKKVVSLFINLSIPLKVEECKRGDKIHDLPPETVYTIQYPDQNLQQRYLKQDEENMKTQILQDVRRDLRIMINNQSIPYQPSEDASSAGITE